MPASAIPGVGKSAYELLTSIGRGGGVRALLVMGSNIAVSAPNATIVCERLKALEFLVVADFFLSETAELADVVLPCTQWAEEEGTLTNLEGRVLRRRRVDGTAGRRPLRPRHPLRARRASRPSRGSSRTRTAKRCSRSCDAPLAAAPRTTPASRTSASKSTRACSGRVRRSVTRARRGCSRTRFRRRTTARAFTPSRIDRLARRRTTRVSRSISRPAASSRSTSRERRRGASRALHDIAARTVRRDASGHGARRRRGRRRSRRAHDPARLGHVRREDDDVDPRGHGVRAVPLGRRAVGQPADERRARSDEQDAGVQGLRGAHRAGRVESP